MRSSTAGKACSPRYSFHQNVVMNNGFSVLVTMASASRPSIRSSSLVYSNDSIRAMSIPELGLDWPYANASWSEIMERSGSNPSTQEGQPSTSLSRSEEREQKSRPRILLIEDNRADVYLIRQAI